VHSSITLKSLRIAQNKLRNADNKWRKESRKGKVEKIKKVFTDYLPLTADRKKSFQFGHPADKNTMVEPNK
jgi:hypothetical protein